MKKFENAEIVELSIAETASGRLDWDKEQIIGWGILPHHSLNDNKSNPVEPDPVDPTLPEDSKTNEPS